jgi:hypothetical protein
LPLPKKNGISSNTSIAMIVGSRNSPRAMLDREVVDVVQRAQLVAHVLLPAIQTEPRSHVREHPGRVAVSHELQRVLGPIQQLADVDEQRVHLARRTRVAPRAEQVRPPILLQFVVQLPQLQVEQLIVVAKLQQLRIRELHNLLGGSRSGLRVVDECRVPCGNHRIVGQIRQSVPEDQPELPPIPDRLATDLMSAIVSARTLRCRRTKWVQLPLPIERLRELPPHGRLQNVSTMEVDRGRFE